MKTITLLGGRSRGQRKRRTALRINIFLGSLMLLGGPFNNTGAPLLLGFIVLGFPWYDSGFRAMYCCIVFAAQTMDQGTMIVTCRPVEHTIC